MTLVLEPHPETPTDVVSSVEVRVHRGDPERLTLTWYLLADTARVSFPARAEVGRGAELWKHTCFELFVRAQRGAYYEFNFSPSQQWAAYSFDDYRSGMRDADPASITGLGGRDEQGVFGGYAFVDLTGLPGLNLDNPLSVGLSAVVEETDGRKSYWALAHPPGKPDFHHPIAFAKEIPTVVYW